MPVVSKHETRRNSTAEMYDDEEHELPPVWAISLDRSVERWEACSAEFAREGLAVERISAVDGAALSEDDLVRDCTRAGRWFCTRGMIGCFLSHRHLWERVVREEVPAVIIFEDDVRLAPSFKANVQQALAELPPDWDVCLLGAVGNINPDAEWFFMLLFSFMVGGGRPSPGQTRRVSSNLFVPLRPAGTHAYVLSLSGARKLLAQLPRARYHVDLAAWGLPELRLFGAASLPAKQAFGASTVSSRSQGGSSWTQRLLRWCWLVSGADRMGQVAGVEDLSWAWQVAVCALPLPGGRRLPVGLGLSSSLWVFAVLVSAALRSTRLLCAATAYQGALLSFSRGLAGTLTVPFLLGYGAAVAALWRL